jgi:hypothetical protein
VGLQTIRAADFDRSDVRSIEELSPLWNRIKTIFGNAHDCKDGGRDENAWCDDVVRPLIDLAMELYGGGKWWLQSVYVLLFLDLLDCSTHSAVVNRNPSTPSISPR